MVLASRTHLCFYSDDSQFSEPVRELRDLKELLLQHLLFLLEREPGLGVEWREHVTSLAVCS